MTKVCSICKTEKPLTEYNKRKNSGDGVRPDCKECRKSESAFYRAKNAERIKEQQRQHYQRIKEERKIYLSEWYSKNKERVSESGKKYRSENKDALNAQKRKYLNKRFKEDPIFRLRCNLRCRVKQAIKKKNYNIKKALTLLGADILVVRDYLELRFKDGMTWDNYGEWHIDHIIPLSSAKTEQELIALCHYKNLQPLWAIDNILKGSKIPEVDNFRINENARVHK